mmetsp:Transcript_114724/g.319537  ORF Transcript_114724/g.319537 Transcript_114724/m.319537 type:complete len:202 (+) Transcript_114724:138-743(+)
MPLRLACPVLESSHHNGSTTPPSQAASRSELNVIARRPRSRRPVSSCRKASRLYSRKPRSGMWTTMMEPPVLSTMDNNACAMTEGSVTTVSLAKQSPRTFVEPYRRNTRCMPSLASACGARNQLAGRSGSTKPRASARSLAASGPRLGLIGADEPEPERGLAASTMSSFKEQNRLARWRKSSQTCSEERNAASKTSSDSAP